MTYCWGAFSSLVSDTFCHLFPFDHDGLLVAYPHMVHLPSQMKRHHYHLFQMKCASVCIFSFCFCAHSVPYALKKINVGVVHWWTETINMLHTCVIIVEGTRLRWHACMKHVRHMISNTTTMLIHLTEMDQVHAYIHKVSTVTYLLVYRGAQSWFLSWLVFLCEHNIQGSKNILPPKPVKMQGWSHRSSSCMENQPVEKV